ncbi:hypothetical protein [Agrobacterium sp. LAD9]|uniref:hypothetical protein n=1 Tax=Agrobacterium sp. LAD9 TaxID=2055153 RepID=UPI000D1FCBDA|nr:hypothetical protein [Agrobacterium sp. LAD9]
MSPNKLSQASKGAAKKADEYDNPEIRHLLSAPVRIGKVESIAKFNLNGDGELGTVKIIFPSPKSCSAQ